MSAGEGDRRVVVVTGGGGGIGAAVAEELGRAGAHVVTVDPMVTLDGSGRAEEQGETTADRIVAAGGSAQATDLSVTDRAGVQALFEELRREHGRLDGVVNVAGITRPTSFAAGTADDWRAVLEVHLDGYRSVLDAALPMMVEQGHGRVLGVTSGSGWRPADTGAYGCAKRAVASLTWELGRQAPPGVAVNAMSPIAVTRMVTAALGKQAARGTAGKAAATGGLSLGSLPAPEELGPLGAHLVGDGFGWCSGQVLFAGGSEVAVVERPRLLEVATTTGAASLAHLVEAFAERALVPAERDQGAGGGSNPRFGDALAAETGVVPSTRGRCLVVTDAPGRVGELVDALRARGAATEVLDASRVGGGFAGAAAALASVEPFDAVVIQRSGPAPSSGDGWQAVLAGHDGIVDAIHADAGWVRAATDRSADAGRPARVVTLVDATTAGGRSRAQAATQLSRASRKATDDRVAAFAVSVEVAGDAIAPASAALAAHLAASPVATDLAGAELVVGAGWLGLRSHPRPSTSIVTGAGPVPGWFDAVLREALDRSSELDAPALHVPHRPPEGS